ncbi:hypothetical protein RHGRI_030853 [Rhododendron griersonianum]|uniref:Transposase n=1 Tax=Rhododendron griersonianum TaxID=479676 RepID=A0AAV6I658_9ERIC|nr:hypothetical protein RHGRI_030853 [Rhododendron griersonianum]
MHGFENEKWEDLEILLGVPVDGEPVIGNVLTPEEWPTSCQRLLGIVPEECVDRKSGKVKMGWLRANFNGQLPEGYTEEYVQRQARGTAWKGLEGWIKGFSLDHCAEFEMWNNRLDHVVAGGEPDPHEYAYSTDDPYMRLFERLRMMEDVDLDVLGILGSREHIAWGIWRSGCARGPQLSLTCLKRKKMSLEFPPWFDSPLRNLRVPDTSFVGRPVAKRKKTAHGDGGSGSLDVAGEVTQLGDDLVGMGGHPLVEGHAELEVQGEGYGVVTQRVSQMGVSDVIPFVVPEENAEEEDDTPPVVVQRKSQHQPHLAACGTGSHKVMHHLKRWKDKK